jgi:di/tricarboxylate transporter
LRNDVVAILIILSLAITGILTPEEALSGFSSEPAIVVVAIFVLSASLERTGVSEAMGRWISQLAGKTYPRAIIVIMPLVAFLSAFTHHLTTTAIMLPIVLDFSRGSKIPASKLLIPLSFAASLGTTITIIGAPAFLVASDVLQRAGRPELGVFSIAPIGLALSVAGTLFMLFFGRFLLPERQSSEDVLNRFRLDNYFTEITILPESPLEGKSLQEVKTAHKYEFTVSAWLRNGVRIRTALAEQRLKAGDVLRIYTRPEDLMAIQQDSGVELHAVEKFVKTAEVPPENATQLDEADDPDGEPRLVQSIVAPNSELIDQTLRGIDFRYRYGAVVVGLWRQQGFIRGELSQVKLRAGDVLVIQGDNTALSRIERDPASLMLVPLHGEALSRRKAPLALIIVLATVLLAAFNLLPLEMAALAGALAAVMTRCLTYRQAYRAIDARIHVFIAGAVPLGAAMQKVGASDLVAHALNQAVGGWSHFLILMAIFAIVGLLTQFMSDSATTALFAPVAVALAQALGHQPEPYVITVAMASIVAFLTPMGHHGNLLVYSPGRYRFNDFVRVGTPLTVLCGLLVVAISLIIWPG